MCMYKKCVCLISVVLLLGLVGNASAADVQWNNAGGDRLWRNSANWAGGAVPTSADKAAIRDSSVSGPIIDASTTGQANQVVLGDWSSTSDTLDMTGGSLTTGAWFILGYGAANNGTFTMSAGTVSVGTDMFVGFMGTGTVDITGGSITVADTFGIAQSGGAGDVFLDGGTISSGAFSMATGAAMDITAGTLIVNGDVTSTINGYISNGWITAYNGTGTVNVDYNVTNPGKTTVTGESGTPPPLPGQATNPSPADGATDVSLDADLSWTAGDYADSHDVYFGTNPTPGAGEFKGNQTQTTYEPGTMAESTTYYWRIDEKNETGTTTGVVWSFTTTATGVSDFTFVQAADPQMTFCADSPAKWYVTIDKVNIVNPAFLMVTGDMLQTSSSQSQFDTYMDAAANLNPDIALYEVPGNHDVSAAPTPAKYTWYESHFGDLWYTFIYGNSLFIGLESCILIDSSGYPGKDTEQMDWLTTTLANASGYDNILVFMHHPLCVSSVDEPDSWVNIPPARRAELLSLFHQYGVRAVFAGHYHQNAYVNDGGLEIITTSSCTCPLASDPPGFRIVDVYSDHIEQAYHTLDSIGPPSPPGQATNPSPADGATDVSVDADLSWTAGSGADSHDVYFGTNPTPGAGEFKGNQPETTYDPGTMANSTTYYWRIDEVNAGGTTTGVVWSFTTEAAACVASTTHVESVVCGTLRLNPPKVYGQVTVTIYDNCGDPVGGADVTGTFTGDFNEQLTETTNGSGVAVITTTTQVKKPSYAFCVDDVTHATLTYDPNDNIETCCSY
jgi:hypothetical protein